MDDPYQTLGVSRDASQKDIRDAYRRLAKQHHPDLNPGNAKAEERFKQVAAANELLSDVAKRGRFDRGEIDAAGQEQASRSSYRSHADGERGGRYGAGDAWSADDLHDMFGSMFGERSGFGDRAGGSRQREGRDEHYAFTADFLDAVNGATRRMTLPDGRVLDVKIPAGTVDGHVLRLRGQGHPGVGGSPAGDAMISITVHPHRYFNRDGQDIRLVLPVSIAEAVRGGPIDVPTPRGLVRMRLPAHADSGTVLRLRGRGVPALGKRAAGDLYATVRVMVGKPDAALEAFVSSWTPEPPLTPRQGMEHL